MYQDLDMEDICGHDYLCIHTVFKLEVGFTLWMLCPYTVYLTALPLKHFIYFLYLLCSFQRIDYNVKISICKVCVLQMFVFLLLFCLLEAGCKNHENSWMFSCIGWNVANRSCRERTILRGEFVSSKMFTITQQQQLIVLISILWSFQS